MFVHISVYYTNFIPGSMSQSKFYFNFLLDDELKIQTKQQYCILNILKKIR